MRARKRLWGSGEPDIRNAHIALGELRHTRQEQGAPRAECLAPKLLRSKFENSGVPGSTIPSDSSDPWNKVKQKEILKGECGGALDQDPVEHWTRTQECGGALDQDPGIRMTVYEVEFERRQTARVLIEAESEDDIQEAWDDELLEDAYSNATWESDSTEFNGVSQARYDVSADWEIDKQVEIRRLRR